MHFLVSNGSGNHILFHNENTFPNETWHVVRTFVSLHSCVWGMSKAENCNYGGHRTYCNLCSVSKWLLEKRKNVKDMLIIKLIINMLRCYNCDRGHTSEDCSEQ